MNRQWKGIGSYLVFFALICLVLMFFEGQLKESSTYTYQQFEHAMEEGEIVSATITPNQETPTGTVMYTLKDGTDRMTNILNTETTEEQLTEAGIPCDIAEVKGPGFFETYGASLLMCGILFFFVVMTMGKNAGGGNARMLDFGRSHAQMTSGGDAKIGFQDVAGLEEEKGELEEIVDFLRNPGTLYPCGSTNSQGCSSGGPSRNWQDPDRQGSSRGGGGSVLQYFRL